MEVTPVFKLWHNSKMESIIMLSTRGVRNPGRGREWEVRIKESEEINWNIPELFPLTGGPRP